MKQYLIDMYARLVSWQTLPPATEQIEAVLGTLDGMVAKLDAAIAQAADEVSASFERNDGAWMDYIAVSDREEGLRGAILAAKSRAETARERIAALTGGAS